MSFKNRLMLNPEQTSISALMKERINSTHKWYSNFRTNSNARRETGNDEHEPLWWKYTLFHDYLFATRSDSLLPLVLSHSSPRRAQAQQRYPLSHGYLFEGPQGNVSSLNRSALALADEQKRRAQTNRRILRHWGYDRWTDDWSLQTEKQIRRADIRLLFQVYPRVRLPPFSFQFEPFDSRIILLKDFLVKYIERTKKSSAT